jgi:hypothetical protein
MPAVSGILETEVHQRPKLRAAAIALLAFAVSGCTFGDRENLSYAANEAAADQVYPENYRTELLAFMKTYLNDPRGVREAKIADPDKKTVGGRQRYVVCLRYNARESDGGYPGTKDRAVLFANGRLDRVMEDGSEFCAKAAYNPFPEMEKLTR